MLGAICNRSAELGVRIAENCVWFDVIGSGILDSIIPLKKKFNDLTDLLTSIILLVYRKQTQTEFEVEF